MSRAVPLVLMLLCPLATAAPVPKALKKQVSPDGTWKLVEFWSNGKKGSVEGMTPVWVLEGEAFYVGPKQESKYWQLTIPDRDNPHLRRFAQGRNPNPNPYHAALDVDGDTLRFCYASDTSVAVTECSPHQNVHYYVFARVTDGSADTPAIGPAAVDELPRKRLVER